MAKGKPLTEAQKKARDEERAKKFKELGSKRLSNAVVAIRRLIPLANKNQYGSTPEQHKAINEHLTSAVKSVADAFAGTKVPTGDIQL